MAEGLLVGAASALRMHEAASASDWKNRSRPARPDWSNACPLSLADRWPSRGANLASPPGLCAGHGWPRGRRISSAEKGKKNDKS